MTIAEDIVIDGLRPAMVWEGSDPGFIPGAKVAVFLGTVDGDPQPGDLPAIVLADRPHVADLGSLSISVRELTARGAEVRANVDLPPDGLLQHVGTLAFVHKLHGTAHQLI